MYKIKTFKTELVEYEVTKHKKKGIFKKRTEIITEQKTRYETGDELMIKVLKWINDNNLTQFNIVPFNNSYEITPIYTLPDSFTDFKLRTQKNTVYVFYVETKY